MEPKGIDVLQDLISAIVKSIKVAVDGFSADDISTHINTAMKAATQFKAAKEEINDLSLSEGLRLNEFISKEVRTQLLGDTEA